MGGFAHSGNGQVWDTSFVDSRSGIRSIADSRYTNSSNSSDNYCTLTSAVDLNNTLKPILHFHAKWSLKWNSHSNGRGRSKLYRKSNLDSGSNRSNALHW